MDTNINVILDMSGSMSTIGAKSVLKSINKYIKDVRKSSPDAYLSVMVFDTMFEVRRDHIRLSDVKKLGDSEYDPRGATALYDAIGQTVTKAAPGRNLFVIFTDGYENSSTKYDRTKLASLIKKTEKKGDQFIFLAANQDAILSAGSVGIASASAGTYIATAKGFASSTSTATTGTQGWVSTNQRVNVAEAAKKAGVKDIVTNTPTPTP